MAPNFYSNHQVISVHNLIESYHYTEIDRTELNNSNRTMRWRVRLSLARDYRSTLNINHNNIILKYYYIHHIHYYVVFLHIHVYNNISAADKSLWTCICDDLL